MKTSALAFLAAALGGCATTTWHQDGATEQTYNRDSAYCSMQQSFAEASVSRPSMVSAVNLGAMWRYCMISKGWESR